MKIERFGNSEFEFKKYFAFIAINVTLAKSAIQNLKSQIESLHYSYTPLLQFVYFRWSYRRRCIAALGDDSFPVHQHHGYRRDVAGLDGSKGISTDRTHGCIHDHQISFQALGNSSPRQFVDPRRIAGCHAQCFFRFDGGQACQVRNNP